MEQSDIVALSKSVHGMGSKLFWWEDFAQTYIAKVSNDHFQLSYDPMTDGDQMHYYSSLSPSVGVSESIESGIVSCSADQGNCKTITGGKKCALNNMIAYRVDGSSEIFQDFELTCTDNGVDVLMSTDPTNEPIHPVSN
jgi:hypothetical protein